MNFVVYCFLLVITIIESFVLNVVSAGLRGGFRINGGTKFFLKRSDLDPDLGGQLLVEELAVSRVNGPREKRVVDESGRYRGRFSNECSGSYLLVPGRLPKKFSVLPSTLEGGRVFCHWELIGSADCVPILTCPNFTLASSQTGSPCLKEYLEVTDGNSGYHIYCGNVGPVEVTSGQNYRDLYVTLKLGSGKVPSGRQLSCEMRCGKDWNENVHSLEQSSEPEVNRHCKCGRKIVSENKHEVDPKLNDVSHKAVRSEFPWVVALVAVGTRKPFCSGTLINDRLVLTAAHCFRGDYAKVSNVELLIRPFEVNVTKSVAKMNGVPGRIWSPEELKHKDDSDESFRFNISRYFLHPLYVKQNNDFDVALVKLSHPIDFIGTKAIVPICLPEGHLWDQTKEGTIAVVTGWGVNQARTLSDSSSPNHLTTLRKQQIHVFENTECKEIFDWRFTDRMMCAGHRGQVHGCTGDGGGSLIEEKGKGVWEQIGILAYSEGCVTKDGPGIFTDLRQVAQWIRYISSSQEAVWCAE